MRQKRCFIGILFSAALLLCLNGCGTADNVEPSESATMQTESSATETSQYTLPEAPSQATTEQENTEPASPAETKPVQAKPAQSNQTQTMPVQTKPVQTTPAQTEPAQTKPVVQIDVIEHQPVIDMVASQMQARMPEAKYEPNWNKGTQVYLPIDPKQSTQTMAGRLVTYLQELFVQSDVDYTYGLGYQGYDVEQSKHVFTVTYSIIEIPVVEVPFDSAAVVSQATQNVVTSPKVQVIVFDGINPKECVEIKEVPAFYNTQEAVTCLSDAVVRQIYTKNLLGADYHEFYIVYDSKTETSHVFLLYLR